MTAATRGRRGCECPRKSGAAAAAPVRCRRRCSRPASFLAAQCRAPHGHIGLRRPRPVLAGCVLELEQQGAMDAVGCYLQIEPRTRVNARDAEVGHGVNAVDASMVQVEAELRREARPLQGLGEAARSGNGRGKALGFKSGVEGSGNDLVRWIRAKNTAARPWRPWRGGIELMGRERDETGKGPDCLYFPGQGPDCFYIFPKRMLV